MLGKLESRNVVWFFGYGSLMWEPGRLSEIAGKPVRGKMKEGIAFRKTAKSRGGAPTLCVVEEGGPSIGFGYPVNKNNWERALKDLCRREGSDPALLEVELDETGKVKAWVFTQEPDIPDDPVEIARRAIDSERKVGSRGGVTYIRNAYKFRIRNGCIKEILAEIDRQLG